MLAKCSSREQQNVATKTPVQSETRSGNQRDGRLRASSLFAKLVTGHRDQGQETEASPGGDDNQFHRQQEDGNFKAAAENSQV
mmetsp:Transcript_65832/g.122819  ORF Transcript_65832/g.122819 Transcript_65832/m.122819 type:complete len:83 (-) Transcript_65832:432-680(-)